MNRKEFSKIAALSVIGTLLTPQNLWSNINKPKINENISDAYNLINSQHKLSPEDYVILIQGKNQTAYVVNKDPELQIHKEYLISTAKNGFGTTHGSYKTPTGIHKIVEKFGENEPINTIFKSRISLKKTATINASHKNKSVDLITSRILWLDGCENHNKTSYKRCIYIHGTSQERFIGTPASYGCIRMNNKDVIELFDYIPKGTYVHIQE